MTGRRGVRGAVLLCGLLWLGLVLVPAPDAEAQSCFIPGSFTLDFGSVTAAGKDANGTVPYTCQSYGFAEPLYYRICLFLDIGNQGPGATTSRRMINYSANTYMDYELYSDPARTQILGPATSGAPVYSWTIVVPPSTQLPNTALVYGRVPPGSNTAAGVHQEQNNGGVLRFRYATGAPPPLVNGCQSGGMGGGSASVSSSGVHATFVNTCTILTATDLQFGAVGALNVAHSQTSTIQLRCPTGTVWRVGLDNGLHPLGATTRRMAGPGGHVTYELYRDSARTQRWGNTVGTDTSQGTGTNSTQTLTVFGRVPAQTSPGAGAYSDTIRITLTF